MVHIRDGTSFTSPIGMLASEGLVGGLKFALSMFYLCVMVRNAVICINDRSGQKLSNLRLTEHLRHPVCLLCLNWLVWIP